MKKLFLLIPALVLSLITNAAVININTGTTDALRKALNSATDGDIIEMAAGTYVESPENWIAFTGKNITVRAAEGAEVILQPQVSIRLKEGATAEFIGIKFDCGHLSDVNAYSDIIFPADATDGKNIILRNCEFYGWTQNNAIIYSASSNTLNSLIIENCYFHDVTKSCVFLENTTNAVDVQITNSTFANIATVTSSYWAGVIDMRSTTGSLLVDHCTFYNVQAMNTDYAAIGKIGSGTTAVVSNCIFAMPTSTSGVRTIRDAVTANNCLVFNYSSDSGYGMQSNVTKNNCTIADPLFVDAANGDFSLAGNWVTMNISPARAAATDGSDLGDPRWYTAETLPSTDFASPYAFIGAKAIVSDKMALNGDKYIASTASGGTTYWKINITRACAVQVTLNMSDAVVTGHNYQVEIFDADNHSVGALNEGGWYNNVDDKTLVGSIEIPSSGNYKVVLTNNESGTTAVIKGITLSYAGGTPIDIPATLLPADAILSEHARIKAGTVDSLCFARADHEGEAADEDYTIAGSQYAKWKINVTKAGYYKFIANTYCKQGHNYRIMLLNEDETSTIHSMQEAEGNGHAWNSQGADLQVATDAWDLAIGHYVLKIQARAYGRVMSVVASYEGGAVVNIPNAAIPFADAILSEKATRKSDPQEIHFGSPNASQYAQWNVHAIAGLYTFTFDVVGTNYGIYKLDILDGSETIFTQEKGQDKVGQVTISNAFIPADGDYVLQLANINSGADGYLTSLAATAEADVFILDENTEDDGSIAAAAGNTYTFLLKRSFEADRYYTICIPVGSWNDELKLAFGDDYELWKMTSATQSGDEIDLNFEKINGQSFHAGWPYIIKPSVAVQNPIFYNKKEIENHTYNNTQSFDAADFIGTFYKSEIPAGINNLYLQNNDLYYSQSNDTPIKGTRAWIHLKPAGGSAGVRARVVLGGQSATAIDLVNGELVNGTVKTIEDGQLVIIRDGVRYNVMGIRLQ